MREQFYIEEEKILARLIMLQSLISEHKLHQTPCPLLASQLNELDVLTKLMQRDIQEMIQSVQGCIRRRPHNPDPV